VDVGVDLAHGTILGVLSLLWIEPVVVPHFLEPVEALLLGDAVDGADDAGKSARTVGAA
jgi:hypothetical protein